MEVTALRSIVLDAYQRYGQKFLLVIKVAIAIAKENRLRGQTTLGDFDYKTLVERLLSTGFQYNPSLLLRALEREYNLLETSYKSSTQRWYKFKYDIAQLESVINDIASTGEDVDDPDVILLKVQLRSLRPKYWLSKLKNMSVKDKLSKTDIKLFEQFSFNVLPKFVKILKRAEEYEDLLLVEINVIKELIQLAQLIAERIEHSEMMVDNVSTESSYLTSQGIQYK